MGQRGPKPTPDAVLRGRGSWRANARGNEPQGIEGRPECPEGMNPRARAVWDRVTAHLERMGILYVTDGEVIAGFCCAVHRCDEANAKLDGKSAAVTWGSAERARIVAEANAASGLIMKYAAKLGLSTADRAGLTAMPKPLAKSDRSRYLMPECPPNGDGEEGPRKRHIEFT